MKNFLQKTKKKNHFLETKNKNKWNSFFSTNFSTLQQTQESFTGMKVIFLGTASGGSSPSRNSSCILLKLEGEIWMFDAGDGAQRQAIIYGDGLARVNRIFITHLHGDHIFGLPGVLCTIQCSKQNEKETIHIYGPVGIRKFVNFNFNISRTRRNELAEHVFHELVTPWDDKKLQLGDSEQSDLIRDEKKDDSACFRVFEDDKYEVVAASLKHSITCFGYVIKEKNRAGKFMVEKAEKLGIPRGRLWSLLQQGTSVQVAGKTVRPDEVLESPRKGRKIIILGDTSNSDKLIPFAMDADLLVHECTYPESMSVKAYRRGHSSISMACDFANKVKAKKMVLTHFGKRFVSNDFSTDEEKTESLLAEAKQYFKGEVVAARDFLEIDIQRHE